MLIDSSMDILEASRKIFSEPCFATDLSNHGQILQIQFSQFEWSQDLILIGFENKVLLARLDLSEQIDIQVISEFVHSCRCTTLSFSPETSLTGLVNQVVFCEGGSDFKLRIYTSDLLQNNTCKVLSSHTNYINDCMFDAESNYLASTGDDNTVKIWITNDFRLKATFSLTSPGINVNWHRSDSCKLLVGEKIGIIRFYNVDTEIPILSLDYSKPLSSCHWAPSDRDLVASLQLGELLIWELKKPCLPLQNNIVFPENGGSIRFSPQGEVIAAVNSLEGSLKIIHIKSQAIKMTASVTLPTNVCWHYRYPLVCVGDDTRLSFWKVSV